MTELPEREDFGDYGRWRGRAVLDPTGRHLGEVREIYLDDATDRPEWVLVELGDDGARFVPLADATVAEDAIKVAQDSGSVEAAPTLEPSKELTLEEERRLYSHYGLRYSEEASDTLLPDPDQPAPTGEAAETTETVETPADDASPGQSGTADAAPQPAAAASAAGRPRLRRHVGAGPELPAPGETSEPADTGPMIPPRPEPVAPPPPPPPAAEKAGALALVRKRPLPFAAAGVAAAVAAVVIILLRRR